MSVLLNTTDFSAAKVVRAAGAPALTTPPVADTNGNVASSFIDAFGNTVTSIAVSAGRLLTESVTATNGKTIASQTFVYKADGSFTQHVDQTTDSGSLATDIAFGPAGQLTETLRNAAGAVTGTAIVTFNPDGSISRHSMTVGTSGFDDYVFKNGDFVSHTHTDGAGTITSYDTAGSRIAGSPTTGGTGTGTGTGTGSTTTMPPVTTTTPTQGSGTQTTAPTTEAVKVETKAAPAPSPENRALFGTVTHDPSSHLGEVYALYSGLFVRAPDDDGARS